MLWYVWEVEIELRRRFGASARDVIGRVKPCRSHVVFCPHSHLTHSGMFHNYLTCLKVVGL